jgi:hypothetical protein
MTTLAHLAARWGGTAPAEVVAITMFVLLELIRSSCPPP